MPNTLNRTISDIDLPEMLDDLRDDNYLDVRLNLRIRKGLVILRAWRKKPVKRRVGRPKKSQKVRKEALEAMSRLERMDP